MSLTDIPQDALIALAKSTIHSRILGTLYGSALGDAIGLYTEFLSADLSLKAYPSRSFTLYPRSEATPFRRDHHRNPHHPGEWTDDTDHAMLILLAYLHSSGKELNPKQLAERLSIWVQMGLRALDTLPLGLGRTVGAIVRTKIYLEDPERRAREHWTTCGYTAAPNGSLMRTHPIGLMCLYKTQTDTFRIASEYSCVTHVDPRCIIACAIGSDLIRGLARGEVHSEQHIDATIRAAIEWYTSYQQDLLKAHPERKDEPDLDTAELWKHAKIDDLDDLKLDEAYKIGYVYKTFGCGIHLLRLAMRHRQNASHRTTTGTTLFETLITDLIMRAGDADTNACFAGALLGAYLGFSCLPPRWRDGLRHGDWLLEKAESLSVVLGVNADEGIRYDGKEDKDTAPDGGRGWLTINQMDERAMRLQARMAEEETKSREMEEERRRGDKGWFGFKKKPAS